MDSPRVRPSVRHRLLLLFVIVALHALSTNATVTDSYQVVPVAQNIVHHGTIALGHAPAFGDQLPLNTEQHHGVLYPVFPWTVSLFVLPVVAVVDAAHGLGIVDHVPADWWIQVMAMSIVVGLTALVLETVALQVMRRGRFRERLWLAALVALVFAFSTSAWSTASRSAWQHGPSMLCLTVGLWALLRSEYRAGTTAIAGAAFAAAYCVRPTNIITLGLVGVWLLARPRAAVPRFAAGAVAVLGPFVLVNLFNYRGLVPAYFRGNTFTGHATVLTALAGNLVSPGRGLFLFNPVVLLAPIGLVIGIRRRALREPFLVLAAAVVAQWLVISLFPKWWGGWSYGPRFFSDVIPFLLVLAVPAAAALFDSPRSGAKVGALTAAGALVAAGFVVNAEGALMRSTLCWNLTPRAVDAQPSRVWSWSNPQLLAGLRGIADNGLRYELARGGAIGHDPTPDDGGVYGCRPFSTGT